VSAVFVGVSLTSFMGAAHTRFFVGIAHTRQGRFVKRPCTSDFYSRLLFSKSKRTRKAFLLVQDTA